MEHMSKKFQKEPVILIQKKTTDVSNILFKI